MSQFPDMTNTETKAINVESFGTGKKVYTDLIDSRVITSLAQADQPLERNKAKDLNQ